MVNEVKDATFANFLNIKPVDLTQSSLISLLDVLIKSPVQTSDIQLHDRLFTHLKSWQSVLTDKVIKAKVNELDLHLKKEFSIWKDFVCIQSDQFDNQNNSVLCSLDRGYLYPQESTQESSYQIQHPIFPKKNCLNLTMYKKELKKFTGFKQILDDKHVSNLLRDIRLNIPSNEFFVQDAECHFIPTQTLVDIPRWNLKVMAEPLRFQKNLSSKAIIEKICQLLGIDYINGIQLGKLLTQASIGRISTILGFGFSNLELETMVLESEKNKRVLSVDYNKDYFTISFEIYFDIVTLSENRSGIEALGHIKTVKEIRLSSYFLLNGIGEAASQEYYSPIFFNENEVANWQLEPEKLVEIKRHELVHLENTHSIGLHFSKNGYIQLLSNLLSLGKITQYIKRFW